MKCLSVTSEYVLDFSVQVCWSIRHRFMEFQIVVCSIFLFELCYHKLSQLQVFRFPWAFHKILQQNQAPPTPWGGQFSINPNKTEILDRLRTSSQ